MKMDKGQIENIGRMNSKIEGYFEEAIYFISKERYTATQIMLRNARKLIKMAENLSYVPKEMPERWTQQLKCLVRERSRKKLSYEISRFLI